ncbi:MAG: hypothetical protein CMI28_02765 [Opitutae bacterium]|nr:hypothetical protein [Opitutae bacterium]HAD21499.1 hypothetical protein [Opitutae bacterium]
MSKSFYFLGFIPIVLILFTSCDKLVEVEESNNSDITVNSANASELDDLLLSSHGDELSKFLSEEDSNSSNSFVEFQDANETEVFSNSSSETLNNSKDLKKSEEIFPKSTLEMTIRELENSSFSHQQGLEKIRELSFEKDQKISSLESENASLLEKIKNLEAQLSLGSNQPVTVNNDDLQVATELDFAIEDLKSSYEANSKEVSYLKEQNLLISDKLEGLGKEEKLEIDFVAPVEKEDSNSTLDILKEIPPEELIIPTTSNCTLGFDAVVTSLNGKSKEAFYTEFFIIRKDLNTLMVENGILLSDFAEVTSYGELWARARKNPFLFPNILKQIRDLLLEEVRRNNGVRIRTDINGSATVQNLDKAGYYVVGTASLGKVGVTWSVPVDLDEGMNKLSLTLGNSSWSF